MRTPSRTRSRLLAPPLCALVTAGLLAGCSEGQDLPDVDLDRIGEDVQEGVDGARRSVQELEQTLDEATLDGDAKAQVEDAVTSAGAAIDEARAAVEGAADDAGPEADQAVADARSALQEAEQKLDAAAGDADGALRTALDALREQVKSLGQQLDEA